MVFVPVLNSIYFESAPTQGNCTHLTYGGKTHRIKYYQEPVNVHTTKDFYIRSFEFEGYIYYNFRYKTHRFWESV